MNKIQLTKVTTIIYHGEGGGVSLETLFEEENTKYFGNQIQLQYCKIPYYVTGL